MKQFLKLLNDHERWLAGYVYTLIPQGNDAEDILQEVKVALWENFDQFEIGTSFAAWSKKVAFYRVLAFRKKKAKESERLVFSESCYQILDENYDEAPTGDTDTMHLLRSCLKQINSLGQEMLSLRYKEDFSIDEIALRTNKSKDACYKAIARLRLQLRQCMTAKQR